MKSADGISLSVTKIQLKFKIAPFWAHYKVEKKIVRKFSGRIASENVAKHTDYSSSKIYVKYLRSISLWSWNEMFIQNRSLKLN